MYTSHFLPLICNDIFLFFLQEILLNLFGRIQNILGSAELVVEPGRYWSLPTINRPEIFPDISKKMSYHLQLIETSISCLWWLLSQECPSEFKGPGGVVSIVSFKQVRKLPLFISVVVLSFLRWRQFRLFGGGNDPILMSYCSCPLLKILNSTLQEQ